MAKKWIQAAIKHPGALTRKAKKAGESPMAFARSHEHAPGMTGKQARLAMTLRSMHGSGAFTKSEQDKGYKVCYSSAELQRMDPDEIDLKEGDFMAKRRKPSRKDLS